MSDDYDELLGISWGDVGDGAKWGFQNVVHPLGKGIATAFGAGAAAQGLEDVERAHGVLPSQPPSSGAATQSPATSPKPKMPAAPSGTQIAQPSRPSATSVEKPSHGTNWQKPVKYAAGAAIVAGVVGLIVHFARKRN